MIQAHIYYSGYVQGVGFRYTVQDIVSRIGGLVGWVKNLPNGQVEVLVEGEKNDIQELIEKIDLYLGGHIRQKDVKYNPSSGEYSDFTIRF